ncbi:unnamed protein product [Amoebophrya sp. A120]|nr:unnamed protein product [Amoebophrya sp. A120]|eukprot:GSA120T00023720001.1
MLSRMEMNDGTSTGNLHEQEDERTCTDEDLSAQVLSELASLQQRREARPVKLPALAEEDLEIEVQNFGSGAAGAAPSGAQHAVASNTGKNKNEKRNMNDDANNTTSGTVLPRTGRDASKPNKSSATSTTKNNYSKGTTMADDGVEDLHQTRTPLASTTAEATPGCSTTEEPADGTGPTSAAGKMSKTKDRTRTMIEETSSSALSLGQQQQQHRGSRGVEREEERAAGHLQRHTAQHQDEVEDSGSDDEDEDSESESDSGSENEENDNEGSDDEENGTTTGVDGSNKASKSSSRNSAAEKKKNKLSDRWSTTSMKINATYVEQRIKEAEEKGYDPRFSSSGQDYFLGSDPDKSLRRPVDQVDHDGVASGSQTVSSIADIAKGIKKALQDTEHMVSSAELDTVPTGQHLLQQQGMSKLQPAATGGRSISAVAAASKAEVPGATTGSAAPAHLVARPRTTTSDHEVELEAAADNVNKNLLSANSAGTAGAEGTTTRPGEHLGQQGSETKLQMLAEAPDEPDEVVFALEQLNSSLSRIKETTVVSEISPAGAQKLPESTPQSGKSSISGVDKNETDSSCATGSSIVGPADGSASTTTPSTTTTVPVVGAADSATSITDVLASCKTAVDRIVAEALKRPHLLEQGSARQQAVEKLASQIRDMQLKHDQEMLEKQQEKSETEQRLAQVDRLVAQMLAKKQQDDDSKRFAVKILTAEELQQQKDKAAEQLLGRGGRVRGEDGESQSPSTKLVKRKKKVDKNADKVLAYFETKYPVMQEVVAAFSNWKQVHSDALAELIWSDQSIPAERFTKLKSYQKINHFVGMCAITRKNNLGRNLLRMKKYYPREYKFFPETWILPTDMSDFKAQFQQQASRNRTFIIKPDNGCQGRGIFLTREWPTHIDMTTPLVAQKYIAKPFLLDGHKFDLRLYVLVTGCDPLRIYLHEKGLVRLASERYVAPKSKNLERQMVHLTNYSINAKNPKFLENDDVDDGASGHKRSLTAVVKYLAEEYNVDTEKLFAEIEELIVKTLISIQPSLRHVYRSCQPEDVDKNDMCFEILGFDVIIDAKGKPWLLEVNHAPSFATESEVDRDAKYNVLRDTFQILQLNPERRRKYRKEMLQRAEARVMGASVIKGGKLTGNKFVSGQGEKAAQHSTINGGTTSGVEGTANANGAAGGSTASSPGKGAASTASAEAAVSGNATATAGTSNNAATVTSSTTTTASESGGAAAASADGGSAPASADSASASASTQAAPVEEQGGVSGAGTTTEGASTPAAEQATNNKEENSNNKSAASSATTTTAQNKSTAPAPSVASPLKNHNQINNSLQKPGVAFGKSSSNDRDPYNSHNLVNAKKRSAFGSTTNTSSAGAQNSNQQNQEVHKQEYPTVAVPVVRELTRCEQEEVSLIEGSTGFKKLYPPTDIEEFVNHYGKFVDTAFDIWETLTGSTSRRYRCQDWIEDRKPKQVTEQPAVKKSKPRRSFLLPRESAKDRLEREQAEGEEELDRRAQHLRSRARTVASLLPGGGGHQNADSKHPLLISSKSAGADHQMFPQARMSENNNSGADNATSTPTTTEMLNRLKDDRPLAIAGQGVGGGGLNNYDSVNEHSREPGAIAAAVADRLRNSMGSRIGRVMNGAAGAMNNASSGGGQQGASNGTGSTGESDQQNIATLIQPASVGASGGVPTQSMQGYRYHNLLQNPPGDLGEHILKTQGLSIVDAPANNDGSSVSNSRVGTANAPGNKNDTGSSSGENNQQNNSGSPDKNSEQTVKKATYRYAHLKMGDVVQVLTNLGWEKVVVRRKLENGRLDILFQDGETMHDVMPRLHDKVASVLNSSRINTLQKILPGYDRNSTPGGGNMVPRTPGGAASNKLGGGGNHVGGTTSNNHGRDNATFGTAPAFGQAPPTSAGLLVSSVRSNQKINAAGAVIKNGANGTTAAQHQGSSVPTSVVLAPPDQQHSNKQTLASVVGSGSSGVGGNIKPNTTSTSTTADHQHPPGSSSTSSHHNHSASVDFLDPQLHYAANRTRTGLRANTSSSVILSDRDQQQQQQQLAGGTMSKTQMIHNFVKPMVVPPPAAANGSNLGFGSTTSGGVGLGAGGTVDSSTRNASASPLQSVGVSALQASHLHHHQGPHSQMPMQVTSVSSSPGVGHLGGGAGVVVSTPGGSTSSHPSPLGKSTTTSSPNKNMNLNYPQHLPHSAKALYAGANSTRVGTGSGGAVAGGGSAATSRAGHNGQLNQLGSNIMKTPAWAGSFSPNKLGDSRRRGSPQKGHFLDPASMVSGGRNGGSSSLWASHSVRASR